MKKFDIHIASSHAPVQIFELFDIEDKAHSKSHVLKAALENAPVIIFDFQFKKIGDSLLALSGGRAIRDILKNDNLYEEKRKIYQGENYEFVRKLEWMTDFEFSEFHEGTAFKISDSDVSADYFFAPEKVPAYKISSDGFIYSSLPHRYYLDIVKKFGTKILSPLPNQANIGYRDRENETGIERIAVVNCSSLPNRKSYPYFENLVEQIAELNKDKKIEFFKIHGGTNSEMLIIPHKNKHKVAIYNVFNGTLEEQGRLLSRMKLVIGNDTGLTHLAALVVNDSATVISLYNRHSHYKWNSGQNCHVCIATPFSYLIGLKDLCPVRDQLDERKWPNLSSYGNIPSNILAEICTTYL